MAFNWKLNAILGLTAFLLTYLFSITNNMWPTSLFRACIGFLIFFILGYVLRLVLNQLIIKKSSSSDNEDHLMEGSNTDLETKNQGDELLEESFQQIPLTGLHSGGTDR